MTYFKRLIAMMALLTLAACGGGGSGGSPFGGPGAGGGGTGGGDGGGGGNTISAADIILETSATQLPNTASSVVNITITAVNEARVVLAGAAVALSADQDGVVTQSAAVTNASGQVTGTLSIGGNRANRLITLTVVSGSVTRTAQVQVVGTTIAATLVPAVVAPSTAAQIQYRVVDQTGNPMVGQAVSVSATGLNPATGTGTTGSNGEFTYAYTSPAAAGSYTVATTIAGLTDTRTITVQGASSAPNVTDVISSASVSANPSVIGINLTGSDSNRSEIRALFLTTDNRPVPNVRVRFDLAGDSNNIGGRFSTGENILYSDANGIVTTAYIPDGRASPTNGVTVRACYGVSDTDPALLACPDSNSAKAALTVVSDPLGVSIGTNELIVVNELSYTKRFLVSVADSAGNAKADVPLSASLDLKSFSKGNYTLVGDAWTKVVAAEKCPNEDLNRNGVLETGEDLDGDSRLEPGRSDVTVRLLSPRTAADGTAIIEITYAKSFGTWIEAWVTVSASGVSGTEGRATYVLDPIPVDAESLSNAATPPAFLVSPYGRMPGCSVSE
jgi:hypothetical protein